MQRFGDAPGAQPVRADRPARRGDRARARCSATVAARARPVRPARSRRRTRATPCTTSAPNILALEKRFAFRPRDFRLWIAIHEVTHRAQFTGVPWMRELLPRSRAAGVRARRPRSARRASQAIDARGRRDAAGPEPARRGRPRRRCSRSPEQRGVLGQVQALMSLLEGHGNVVMTELGRRHVAGEERMARVLHQRRQSGGLTGAAAQAARARAEDAPVRGRRAVRARRRRHRRARVRSTRVWRASREPSDARRARRPGAWLTRGRPQPVAGCELDAPALAPCVDRLVALDDRRRHAVVVGCSGGADSLALLALVRAARSRTCAVYVDHGLRAGLRTTRDVVARGRGAVRVPASAWSRVDIDAGRQPRSARARRAVRRARSGSRAEVGAAAILVGAHARRPGRDRAAAAAAGQRARPGSRAWPPRARLAAAAAARVPPAPTRARSARALRLAPVHDPMNDDAAPPARVVAARGDPAARARRRPRSRRGARPAGRGAARRRRAASTRSRRALRRRPATPLDAAASPRAGRARPAGGAAVARRAAAVARDGRRRARRSRAASARAVELPGGERVERVGGRLHRVGDDGRCRAAAGRARRCPGGAAFGAFASRPGSSTAPPVAWPDGRARAVCDADRVGPDGQRPCHRSRASGSGRSAAAARSSLVATRCGDAGVPRRRRRGARRWSARPNERSAGSSVTVSTIVCGSPRAPGASSG